MTKRKNFGPLQDKLDADKTISKSYRKFDKSLKTLATRTNYMPALDRFMRFANIPQYDAVLAIEAGARQDIIEDWIMSMKTPRSAAGNFHALRKFLNMNRAVFWPSPAIALFPSSIAALAGGKPYTTEDIQIMLDVAFSLRVRAIVLFFTSTACRPGAFQDEDGHLQLKHLKEMPLGCANVKIYAGTKFEYDAFLTPEAYTALKRYHSYREEQGETLTPESPMFANEKASLIPNYKGNSWMACRSVDRVVRTVINKAGIKRVTITGNKKDKALTYGFRKRFNTILKINNEINSNIAEKLMAHSKGLDGVYLTPSTEECFAEFSKAIAKLTINKEDEARARLAIAEQKLEGTISREQLLLVFDLFEKEGIINQGNKRAEFLEKLDTVFKQ